MKLFDLIKNTLFDWKRRINMGWKFTIGITLLLIITIIYYEKELNKYTELIENMQSLHKEYIAITEQRIENILKYNHNIIEIKNNEIELLKNKIQITKHIAYIGDFIATAYDLSIDSCGKAPNEEGYGITKDGTNLINKTWKDTRTIAVNPHIIPLGSKIYIEFEDKQYQHMNGIYIARDTGNFPDNVIDIFLGDYHSIRPSNDVIEFGRRKIHVYKVIEGSEENINTIFNN